MIHQLIQQLIAFDAARFSTGFLAASRQFRKEFENSAIEATCNSEMANDRLQMANEAIRKRTVVRVAFPDQLGMRV